MQEAGKGCGIGFALVNKIPFMAEQKGTAVSTTSIDKAHESDAKKLADRHMADPDHTITDEEMASIRVGVSGVADAPTKQAVKEGEDRIADTEANNEDETIPGAQKSTPWDVIK